MVIMVLSHTQQTHHLLHAHQYLTSVNLIRTAILKSESQFQANIHIYVFTFFWHFHLHHSAIR